MKTSCATEAPNSYPQKLQVRKHEFRADIATDGGADSAPGPHDYFDAALAACKALTATWYARRSQIPLERVDVTIERDDSQERKGKYSLRVALAFHGPMSAEQKTKLHSAVAACPVHKLMTTTEIAIETAPLD